MKTGLLFAKYKLFDNNNPVEPANYRTRGGEWRDYPRIFIPAPTCVWNRPESIEFPCSIP